MITNPGMGTTYYADQNAVSSSSQLLLHIPWFINNISENYPGYNGNKETFAAFFWLCLGIKLPNHKLFFLVHLFI